MTKHSELVTVLGKLALLRLGGHNDTHASLENKLAHCESLKALTEPHSKVRYFSHTLWLCYVQHKNMCIVLQSQVWSTANSSMCTSTLHTFFILWLEAWEEQASLANQTISFHAAQVQLFCGFTWVHTNHSACYEHCLLHPSSHTLGVSTPCCLSCKFISVFTQCNV